MSSPKPTLWYKQFWPWFLIVIPALSMVLSLTMLTLALNSDDSLVIDDYYKQGKAINASLARLEQAKEMGLEASLMVSASKIELVFKSGTVEESALKIGFYHATQAHKDQEFTLLRDAAGVYRSLVDQALEGKWSVTLSSYNDSWKLQQSIYLPQTAEIALLP